MNDADLLTAICEIRDLVRLIAEPQIAARDQKLREALRRIVGHSAPKQKSVLLMDGTRTQTIIRQETGINAGHLSTMVKQLAKAKLLADDHKHPALVISIPQNFFAEESNE
jgi:hypothetical protein